MQQNHEKIILDDGNIYTIGQTLTFIGIGFCFLFLLPTMLLAIQYFGSGIGGLIASIVLLNTVLIGSFFMLYQVYLVPYRIMQYYINNGNAIIALRAKEEKNLSSIDEVINSLFLLQKTLRNFLLVRKLFKFLLTKETNKKINRYLHIITNKAVEIIKNLQGDLKIDMSEKIDSINLQKNEIEKTLIGNNTLMQVSELQRVRLDRQIEQFEELQKVLN